MNKVITINLNGNAYQLEEAAYEALRAYLDSAARQLEGNPDKDEIVADIEQAIADKCRAVLSANRTVVSLKEIEQIISEMGPVDGGSTDTDAATDGAKSAAGSTPPPAREAASTGTPKRLYRLLDGAMISGVCNGLAAYFNIDPALIRIGFVLFAFITVGGIILAYVALSFILPVAATSSEKAAAQGIPSTAQDFIRRAREGYYGAARTWGDKDARREWKRNFKREMRSWRYNFHREMDQRAGEWRQSWHGGGCPPAQPGSGMWFALPFIAIFRAIAIIALVLGIISLLSKGTLFSIGLPAGLPVWAAIFLLVVFYNLIVWPVRAVRHAVYHSWVGPRHAPGFLGFWDGIVWLSATVFLIWILNRHVSLVHEALVNIKPAIHQALHSFKEWWSQL